MCSISTSMLTTIKESLNKLSEVPCSWMRELSIDNVAVLITTKVYFLLIQCNPNKIPAESFFFFFLEINKPVPKSILQIRGARRAKTFLKNDQVEGFALPDFKIYYKEWSSRQGGIRERKDTQIRGTKQRVQDTPTIYMVKWSWQKYKATLREK